MFADRIPCDIVLEGLGEGLENKEKSTVVHNYLEYGRQEKEKISEAFSSFRGKNGGLRCRPKMLNRTKNKNSWKKSFIML